LKYTSAQFKRRLFEMPQRIEVPVTIDQDRITVEFTPELRMAAIEFVRSLAGDGHGRESDLDDGFPAGRPQTERDFVERKKPSGHAETIAVLAFFLREAGTLEFSAEDIRRAYIRASVRPPKAVAQALRDAKNRYEYLEAGARGTFRLSQHGERTVLFDLPRTN
jgi:hypothetical protein